MNRAMFARRTAVARAWVTALVVVGVLARTGAERPSSEAPLLLAVVALAALLPRSPRWLPGTPRQRELAACLLVAALGLFAFGPIVRAGDAGHHADWSQNVAVVDEIVHEWRAGRPTPTVFLGVAAGDPTRDLYATLVHQLAAGLAITFGLSTLDATMSLVLVAWILAAVAVTRLALRFSSWPIAILAGIACLFDSTTMFTWGVAATWYWGLFPSTCAIAVVLNGLPSLVDLASQPATPRRVALVWLCLGLGALVHPIGLLFDGVLVIAGALCAIASRDETRTRWARVTLHAAIAVGLGAFSWLPTTARLTLYAAHFGNPQIPVLLALQRSVTGLLPETAFGTLMGIGVFTLFAGRRAASFAWVAAWVMLALYLDPLFLDLGLAPTSASARLQCFRTTSVAMPLLYAATGALLSTPTTVPLGGRPRLARAVAAIACCVGLAWVGPDALRSSWTWASAHARTQLGLVAQPRIGNRGALDELLAWLRTERAALPEGQQARAAYEWSGDPINEVLRAYPESGVPITTHGTFVPVFVSREQIHATSGANFRRWGVRWSIGGDQTTPRGDATTEQRFGMLRVRTVSEWDGSIVHVVRGEGTARLLESDDQHLVLDVDAREPVLVEIGVPYYPRWRGAHDGAPVRVCARPIDPNVTTEQRVLAAWLPPGRSVLRPDGPLPSDPIGWPGTILAALVALVAWPGRRPIPRLDRLAGALLRWPLRWLGSIALVLAALAFVVVPARQGAFGGVQRSLRFGGMFRPITMQVVTGPGPLPCEARGLLGRELHCAEGVRASMTVTHNVQDAPVGWPVPLPGILIAGPAFEVTIHAPGVWDAGEHRVFCGGACRSVAVRYGGEEHSLPPGSTRTFVLPAGQQGLDLRVVGGGGEVPLTLVRSDAIDVDRHADVPFCGDRP